jgi:subfamily B ATP-binding cassette protein MsbA
MGYVSRYVVSQLRRQLFERAMRLPVAFYDGNSSATLLSKLTYNTEQIGQATTDSVVLITSTALTLIGIIAYLLYLNWRLAIVALTMAPLVSWLVTQINRKFRRYSRRIQDSMGDVTRIAKEGFEAPRLVKVYNAEPHLAAQFQAVNEHNRRSNMKLILTRGLSNPIVQSITAVGGAIILFYALASVVHGRMSMGELLGFFTGLGMIAQPLRQLVGASGPLQQGIAAAQSLFELIDEPSERPGDGHVVTRVRGEVELDRVSFRYQRGSAAALREVSLKVAAGENVALVGRSGSGKSTLVSLLPRFYDVSSGSVRIDGRDVLEYDLSNLREQIAVVSQEVVLFNDTIRNNIAFGRTADPEAIERAAEAAHVMEFVRSQPSGLDTLVGDRGVLLSGGQRQRIAIARALLKDAPILILDEATSALDTEAERHIQAALAHLKRNRTTFVIAHRLSTVEQADRIIVLDGGSIIESGTHGELIARDGRYAQLYRLQFSD